MNLPNKLTTLRILLMPVFVGLTLTNTRWGIMAGLLVFIIASITDAADGYIARKYSLVTDFGKFLDPLADKILTISAFVCMMKIMEFKLLMTIFVIVVILREFMVTSLRLIAASGGRVIAADMLGKYKTVSQMLFIIAGLFLYIFKGFPSANPYDFEKFFIDVANPVTLFLMGLSMALTVVSGVSYLVKNRDIIKEK